MAREGSPPRRVFVAVYGAVLILFAFFLIRYLTGAATLNEISRDPLATMDGPALTGVQSVAGVLILWSAASIAFATWTVIRGEARSRSLAWFMLVSGMATAWLAIDDQFMFHDALAHSWFGLRERYVFAAYAVVLGLYAVLFRRFLVRFEPVWLLLAAVFAALSVAGDFISQQGLTEAGLAEPEGPLNYLEDVAKLLAITSWSAYLIRYSIATLLSTWRQDASRSR